MWQSKLLKFRKGIWGGYGNTCDYRQRQVIESAAIGTFISGQQR